MLNLALIDLMGAPENASAHGVLIDNMNNFVHWFMLILLVGWGAFFLYCLYRFHHSRNPKADYYGARTHFSTHLELGVIITEVMLLLGFAFPLWTERVNDFPVHREDRVNVRVIGEQFNWQFHYPGPDGVFGRTRAELVNKPSVIGLDPEDPAAADDIVKAKTMTIPVKRPLVMQITSRDVIHNFALPNMRLAQDAIPGMSVGMWFEPIKIGSYEAVCGQLCGNGHSFMSGYVEVVSEEDYAKFLKNSKPDLPAPAPKTAQVKLPGVEDPNS
jgi:cytochrome c oxidase subunit 2